VKIFIALSRYENLIELNSLANDVRIWNGIGLKRLKLKKLKSEKSHSKEFESEC
jgi:hypothetical protein